MGLYEEDHSISKIREIFRLKYQGSVYIAYFKFHIPRLKL